jgi:hypothetical protein
MNPDAPELRYCQATAPLRAEFQGETVLLSFDTGRYYGLEGTAQAVWRLLETPRSLADLVEALVGSHDVDRAQCRRDLVPFLEDLAREGLVEACG